MRARSWKCIPNASSLAQGREELGEPECWKTLYVSRHLDELDLTRRARFVYGLFVPLASLCILPAFERAWSCHISSRHTLICASFASYSEIVDQSLRNLALFQDMLDKQRLMQEQILLDKLEARRQGRRLKQELQSQAYARRDHSSSGDCHAQEVQNSLD